VVFVSVWTERRRLATINSAIVSHRDHQPGDRPTGAS
jgi:hypothetical protein